MGPKNPESTSGLRLLSREKGTPAVDLSSVVIPLDLLDYVPENVALRSLLLPLRADAATLFVAMADPSDQPAIDEVAFLSGKKVVAYAAPERVLRDVIAEVYVARRRGDVEWRGPRAAAARPAPRATHAPPLPEAMPHGQFTGPLSQALRLPEGPARAPAIREPFSADAGYPLASPRPNMASGRRRVLVVDDEPVICRIVHQALAQRGYEVLDAHGGMEALKLIKEHEPHAILLDAMLPDVHGFDIAKRLRESRRYRHIPVIIMTAVYKGWRMAADLKETYGVAGYVEKPFNIHDVVRLLEDALAGVPSRPPDAAALSAEASRLYSEGMAAYQRGDLEGAIGALVAAVAIDPLSATLRHQLGLLYAWRGQDFAAIQELEMAVELEPTRFTALRNLAILFQRRGFRRKACEMWERALAHAPDDATRQEIKDILLQLL